MVMAFAFIKMTPQSNEEESFKNRLGMTKFYILKIS